MSIGAIVLIVFFAFLASFIQRVSGFGFGIVFMTVAPFVMPSYGEATALSGMLAIVCALGTGIRMFKFLPWKKLVGILMTFLVVSFFAVRMVAHIDSHTLKHVLGYAVAALFYLNAECLRHSKTYTGSWVRPDN